MLYRAEVAEYVIGVSGSVYRRHSTHAEALRAWEDALANNQVHVVP